MKTTILMAGLLAGLMGTAVLAQTAPAPTDGTAPEATAPVPPAPERGPGGPDGFGRGFAPFDLLTADADGDGAVTQEEIEAQRQARFTTADADGNGGLSAEELLAMEDAVREEARAARVAERIAQIDDNGDGILQAEEIEARTPQIAPLFDRLDTDGDNAISQAELDAGRPQVDGREGGFGRGDGGRDHGGRGGHGGPRGDRAGGGFLGGLFGGQEG